MNKYLLCIITVEGILTGDPDVGPASALLPGADQAVYELERRGWPVTFLSAIPQGTGRKQEMEDWIKRHIAVYQGLWLKFPGDLDLPALDWRVQAIQFLGGTLYEVKRLLFVDADAQSRQAAVFSSPAFTREHGLSCFASLEEALAATEGER